jgi:hypothetical protein
MPKKIALLPPLCLALLLAPACAWACSACTLEYFAEKFPFQKSWFLLFFIWVGAYFLLVLASLALKREFPPRTRRIFLESGLIFAVVFSTGLSVLLLYWVFMIARELWLTRREAPGDMPAAARGTVLYLNGFFLLALMISAGLAYPGHDEPERMMARLSGRAYQQPALEGKIVARGAEMVPLLGEVLMAGAVDPVCADDIEAVTAESCRRARTAAHLLGRIGDEDSLAWLLSAAGSGTAAIAAPAGRVLASLAENENQPAGGMEQK